MSDFTLFLGKFLKQGTAIASLAPDLNIINNAERILLALAAKHPELIGNLLTHVPELVVGGLTALGGSGFPEEAMDLTWEVAQSRREEMGRRMSEARRKKKGQPPGDSTTDT